MKPLIPPLGVLVVLASPSIGQQVLPPAPAADAPIELSPFLVDATKDLVCAYKPQIAYFAAVGAERQLEAPMPQCEPQSAKQPLVRP